MRHLWKPILWGVLAGSLALGGAAFAASKVINIEVSVGQTPFKVNGELMKSEKVSEHGYFNGKTHVPLSFNYQGTTYVPIRYAGELLGKNIGYDPKTGTVSINEPEQVITLDSIPYEIITDLFSDGSNIPPEVAQWIDSNRHHEVALTKDFGNHTYALITRGEMKTGGYDIEFEGAFQRPEGIDLYVKYKNPDPGSVTTQVISYPTLLVKFNKFNQEAKITFKIEK